MKLRSGMRLFGAVRDNTVVQFTGTRPGVMLSLTDCENVEVAQLTLSPE